MTDLNGRLLGYTQTYGLPDTNDNSQAAPYAVMITGGNSVMYADFGYADGHLLTITKTNNVPAGKPVEAGADMIYTLSYTVSGRAGVVAPNVVITDPLNPNQLDFIEASNGGTYDIVTHVVTWKLGDLKPGDQGSVTIKVHVKKPLANNSYIFNTATIVDDAKVRDESTDVIRVHAEPILGLTKTADPTGTVKPGDTIKYTRLLQQHRQRECDRCCAAGYASGVHHRRPRQLPARHHLRSGRPDADAADRRAAARRECLR